ncbi:MAG: sialidase family protein [Bryobacteraceae bacterium]
MIRRREFLAAAAGAWGCGKSEPAGDLIARVEPSVIWKGRETGVTWFHPRACRLRGGRLLMATQTISGSDVFGPVHWSESTDGARTWSDPRPIPGLGRRTHPDGVEEGVCDTVPQEHPATGAVIFMGWNVYYKDGKLTRPNEQRWPVYVVRRRDGSWTGARKLDWGDPESTAIYGSNCSQRLTLPDGDLLVPLTYGPLGKADRGVGTVRCAFDGEQIAVKAHGNTLHLAVKRGLLEPSLTRLPDGRFAMTIRAEDDRGYVSLSEDGLTWGEKKAWSWDDGEPLTMSTTQQHWLEHSAATYLVYTRKSEINANVMRWRAPLYAARLDPARMTLERASERVVVPMTGDGISAPDTVARLGNFHVTAVSRGVSLVTAGETMPARGWSGNTLQAAIHWSRPNELVGEG